MVGEGLEVLALRVEEDCRTLPHITIGQDEARPFAGPRWSDHEDMRRFVGTDGDTTEQSEDDSTFAGQTPLRRFHQIAEASRSVRHLSTVDVGEERAGEAKGDHCGGGVSGTDECLGARRRIDQPLIKMAPCHQKKVGGAVGILHREQRPAAGALAREPVGRPAQRDHHLIRQAPEQAERQKHEKPDANAECDDAAHRSYLAACSRRQSGMREK